MMKRLLSLKLLSLIIGGLTISVLFLPNGISQNPVEKMLGTSIGWSDDINLSENSLHDKECQLEVFNNNIHAIWVNNYSDIVYSKSIDEGRIWSPHVSLYHSSAALAFTPVCKVSGQNVHLGWGDRAGWDGVYYRNSTDNGISWNSVKRMSPTGVNAYGPYIFVNGSTIHYFWHDKRDGADGEIYYRRSLDGGITFDNGQGVDMDRRITFSPAAISGIQVAGYGSNISVIWADDRTGNWQLYWMISKDNGYTWEDGLGNINAARRISNSIDSCQSRAIAVEGLKIHMVWSEEQWPGPVDRIFYRNSTDNGATWNPIQLLCGPNSGCGGESIDVNGDNIWVMWGDIRDGPAEIHFRNSTDGGINWGNDTRLTELDGYVSTEPKIALTNSNIHVVWIDERDGNREIYFKRSPDFPPDPTFTIPINVGWNLISTPLIPRDESVETVLQNISGKWDVIKWYDNTDVYDPWKSYRPGGTVNDLSGISNTIGFWLHATEACNLTVSGVILASTNIPLHAGWNLVGYPSQTSDTVANALWGTGADRVEVFDPVSPYIKEVGPTYIMKPGEGYWVHVPTDSVWIVSW